MSRIINSINTASEALLKGNPVAIPTETVYGLAALATNEEAIAKIFTLKKRPRNHPLIMHVAPEWDIAQWACNIPEYAYSLIQNFWPGPLTLVLPYRQGSVSPLVNANQTSIALRCPSHPLTLELLRKVKVPLVAPSANPFGKISPTTAQHVLKSFPDADLYILDGGRCPIGIESTIVSALDPGGWQILRAGRIHADELKKISKQSIQQRSENIRVSGNLKTHYQPEKPLWYFESIQALTDFLHDTPKRVFVLHSNCPENHPLQDFAILPEEPEAAARELYYQLRLADESAAECIALVLPDSTSANQGIRERIIKAGKPGDL